MTTNPNVGIWYYGPTFRTTGFRYGGSYVGSDAPPNIRMWGVEVPQGAGGTGEIPAVAHEVIDLAFSDVDGLHAMRVPQCIAFIIDLPETRLPR